MTTDVYSFPRTATEVPRLLQLETVGSTNDTLRASGWSEPYSLVLATHQRLGKGRRGRVWFAERGESLAVSVLLPTGEADEVGRTRIPLLVGLAVVNAVREMGITGACVKWPNDVLVDRKKLSGILCEVVPGGKIIAGIGLNLVFGGIQPTPSATSLADCVPFDTTTPDTVLLAIVGNLRKALTLPGEAAIEAIRSVTDTRGRDVEVLEPDGSRWSGHAHDVDSHGHLLVRDASGVDHSLSAADVEHLYQ